MNTKRCPYCSEEILMEAKKCKHCGEFLDKKNSTEISSKSIFKIVVSIVIIVLIYNLYSAMKTRAEYTRNVVESFEKRSDTYRLPSGKVIDLINVPSEYKYEVKTYLTYKDKRDSWSKKAYEEGYGSGADYQVGIFDGIIEDYETEHPQVRENSYSVRTVSE